MQIQQSYMQLGRVFTPILWAEWCLETFGIYQAWRDGATILEPICGDGVFFKSLTKMTKQRGDTLSPNLFKLLFGVEIVHSDKSSFLQEFFDFPEMYFQKKITLQVIFFFAKVLRSLILSLVIHHGKISQTYLRNIGVLLNLILKNMI